MIWQFGKIKNNKVIQIVNKGTHYNGLKFSIDDPDTKYTNLGLLPIIDEDIQFNKEHYTLKITYDVQEAEIYKIYNLTEITLEKRKEYLINQGKKIFDLASIRPKVPLMLESTVLIEIDGGRNDKDNFKEKYQLMERLNETVGAIKDADNGLHVCTITDVENCYLNIVAYHDQQMLYKWSKEQEILACTTLEEINNISL